MRSIRGMVRVAAVAGLVLLADGCTREQRLAAIIWTTYYCSMPFFDHDERTYFFGAYAKVETTVVDEDGNPIPGAEVAYFFETFKPKKSNHQKVIADVSGVAVADELTSGDRVSIKATHPGYYASSAELRFNARGKKHEVNWRRWEPKVTHVKLRLRKIKNPTALTHDDYFLHFPSTNAWCGVDLLRRDWVAPNGKGETADVELYYTWEGETPQTRTEDTLALRFPEKPNGGTKTPAVPESEFPYSYEASTNLLCAQSFTSRNRSYWSGHLIESDFDLTFRIRSVTNSAGEITSCRYGRFGDVEYGIRRDRTAVVLLRYDLNPTPMDNNLERKKR